MISTAIIIWLWVVGAYSTWEDVRKIPDTGPDPAGYFYSEETRKFADEHPEFGPAIRIAANIITCLFWPATISLGIIRVVHLELRARQNGR